MQDTVSNPFTLSTAGRLRSMMEVWAFTAILPLPIEAAQGAEIGCIYLGIFNAWLVTEYHRTRGAPVSVACWWARARVITVTVSANLALYVGFGLAGGVHTNFPFPLMAALSTIPALGVVPWMLRKISRHPYGAIVLSGFLILACKLAGCVVARVVYGPDYIAQGYVSADWRTAKLMITLFWSFSTLLSLALLMVDYRCCARTEHHRAD